jgi:hypothetical protein
MAAQNNKTFDEYMFQSFINSPDEKVKLANNQKLTLGLAYCIGCFSCY